MICCIAVAKIIFSTIGVGTAETVQIHLATISMSVVARRQDSNLFVFFPPSKSDQDFLSRLNGTNV